MRTRLRSKQPRHRKYTAISWLRLIIIVVLSLFIAFSVLFWLQSTEHVVPIYWYLILTLPIILIAISLTLPGFQRLLSTSSKEATSLSSSTAVTPPLTNDQTPPMEATAQNTEILMFPVLPRREGAIFLLRAVGILPPNSLFENASAADYASASEVAQLLNGLPLALTLAGTYIRETNCSFSDYAKYYQNQRTKLLKTHRNFPTNQLESVTITCTLTFQKVEQSNATAADLFRLMAYLSPDAIPEEIITVGVSNLDTAPETIAVDKKQLDSACTLLHKYSLLHRDTEARTLSVDYLVQAVLRDEMKKKQQRQWAEYATRAVARSFPSVGSTTWHRYELFLLQALTCITYLNDWKISLPETIQLLHQVGYYLEERGLYTEAEPLYQQTLTIREKMLGPTHPFTAASLTNLATFYERQGKYEQAEPLYQQALAIYEKVLGSTHPTTALVRKHYIDLLKKRKRRD